MLPFCSEGVYPDERAENSSGTLPPMRQAKRGLRPRTPTKGVALAPLKADGSPEHPFFDLNKDQGLRPRTPTRALPWTHQRAEGPLDSLKHP
jgi:hypothetical protein